MAAPLSPTSSRVAPWRNWGALGLLLLGSLSMLGDGFGIRALRGLGAATAAAPLPKVFSDVDGLETFASRFTLEYETADGQAAARPITPELYRRLAGPYNRRNVYGAALSYAPRLPARIWQRAFCFAFAAPAAPGAPAGPLRREFEVPDAARRVRVRIDTQTRGRSETWTLEPSCLP